MDILAAILEIFAAILMGNKNRLGFPIFMLGNLCWCYVGITEGLSGLVFVSTAFFVINIRNYNKWSK